MRRGSSAASTTDGMPRRTSGIEKRVPSAATRRSHAAAISRPAPITAPCSRATTGTGSLRIASHTAWIFSTKAPAFEAFSAASSCTSAPPQNALAAAAEHHDAHVPGSATTSNGFEKRVEQRRMRAH